LLSLSEGQTRLVRCLNGRLVPGRREETDVTGVLRGVCGVQAQLWRAAALALRARGDGLLYSDVVRARERERSAVKAWFMRGTIHLVATEDVGWLLSLFGPVFVAAGRRRLAQLGLDEDAAERGVRLVRATLADAGPMTRQEILARLRQRGVVPEPDGAAGYASTHLLRRAALEGVVCFGPDLDGEETYVLSSDWGIPEYRGTRESALAELTRRYLAAHGPADPEDLATWSGLPMRDARAGWRLAERGFDEVRAAGRPAWVLSGELPEEPPPFVRLLPHFDPYLLGYRDRSLAVPPRYAARVQRGGGFVRPAAILSGQAIATWEYRSGGKPDVSVDPFEELVRDTRTGLEAETEDIGRFLNTHPGLTLHDA
jgi:hypothetical protein